MQRPKIEIENLRVIGWSNWDPIGLADNDGKPPYGAQDEYDTYLLQAAGMLVNGRGSEAAIRYLTCIAVHHMGLGYDDGVTASKTVDQIRRYLIKLGYEVR